MGKKFLFLLLILVPSTATFAAAPVCSALLQRIENADFMTARDLSAYKELFGARFSKSLAAMGPEDVWLDAGSGQTFAMMDYMEARNENQTARGIAVSYTEPHFSSKKVQSAFNKFQREDRFKVISGVYFEDVPKNALGSPKLITDLYGVISYSSAPDVILSRYLDILDPEGSIYIYTRRINTLIRSLDGVEMDFFDYVKSIPGIQVVKNNPGPFTPYISIQIHRTEQFKSGNVPALKLLKMTDGAPPVRRYRVIRVH